MFDIHLIADLTLIGFLLGIISGYYLNISKTDPRIVYHVAIISFIFIVGILIYFHLEGTSGQRQNVFFFSLGFYLYLIISYFMAALLRRGGKK